MHLLKIYKCATKKVRMIFKLGFGPSCKSMNCYYNFQTSFFGYNLFNLFLAFSLGFEVGSVRCSGGGLQGTGDVGEGEGGCMLTRTENKAFSLFIISQNLIFSQTNSGSILEIFVL